MLARAMDPFKLAYSLWNPATDIRITRADNIVDSCGNVAIQPSAYLPCRSRRKSRHLHLDINDASSASAGDRDVVIEGHTRSLSIVSCVDSNRQIFRRDPLAIAYSLKERLHFLVHSRKYLLEPPSPCGTAHFIKNCL